MLAGRLPRGSWVGSGGFVGRVHFARSRGIQVGGTSFALTQALANSLLPSSDEGVSEYTALIEEVERPRVQAARLTEESTSRKWRRAQWRGRRPSR